MPECIMWDYVRLNNIFSIVSYVPVDQVNSLNEKLMYEIFDQCKSLNAKIDFDMIFFKVAPH